MNIDEAKIAAQSARVSHVSYNNGEWFTQCTNGMIYTSNDDVIPSEDFWKGIPFQDGYFICD